MKSLDVANLSRKLFSKILYVVLTNHKICDSKVKKLPPTMVSDSLILRYLEILYGSKIRCSVYRFQYF